MPVPFSSLRRLRQTRVCTFSSTMATLDVKGYAASWRVFQFGCCRCESYYTCWSPLIRAKTASGPKASPTKALILVNGQGNVLEQVGQSVDIVALCPGCDAALLAQVI